jgi:NIPSNAP
MIHEVRTYTLRTGAVAEFEDRFTKRKPLREKHSKLGAFWHTDFGPLNQVIHVWPYEDLQHRTAVREAMAKDPELNQLPGDFGSGNVYEMRIYTYAPGDIPAVLEAWGKAVPAREKLSPLAACWSSELGGLNKFVHVWVYPDLNARVRIREESRKGGQWPPQSGVRPIRQENKVLIPAAFSPLR